MTKFYETDGVSNMTSQELDEIALEKCGVVDSIGYGYATRGKVGEQNGWSAQWIATGGMGNCGTLVLVPLTPRTRAISREGKIRAFMRAGLSRVQAERLHHARVQYKFELLNNLAEILHCKGKTLAMLAHPRAYGPGSGRTQWDRAWGMVFGPEILEISIPRETELAKMVAACVGEEEE